MLEEMGITIYKQVKLMHIITDKDKDKPEPSKAAFGLHENYLNELTERYENNIIPNAVEFLSENWAIALYHEWFGDFALRMRQGIQSLDDVQKIIGHAFDKTSKERKGISRDMIK